MTCWKDQFSAISSEYRRDKAIKREMERAAARKAIADHRQHEKDKARSRSIDYKKAAQIPPNERNSDIWTTSYVPKYTSRFAVVSEACWTTFISACNEHWQEQWANLWSWEKGRRETQRKAKLATAGQDACDTGTQTRKTAIEQYDKLWNKVPHLERCTEDQ